MGTYLAEKYGADYFVSGALSYVVTKATWWNGEVVFQPSPLSFEGAINQLYLGNAVVDMRASSFSLPIEVLGVPNITMSSHWDSVFFIPKTEPMTTYPGVFDAASLRGIE